ncbi:MAG: ABC transporter permease [Streptosporangiaceae bacterium]
MSQATDARARTAAGWLRLIRPRARALDVAVGHLAVPVALVLVWWALAATVGPSLVASPPAAVRALVRGAASGWLTTHGAATLLALVYGYALALLVGAVVGFAIASSRFAYDVLQPLIYALYTLPKVTLFPIFLFIFGISTASQAWFAMFFGVFPILIFTTAGVREVRPVLLKVAKVLRFGPIRRFQRVVLPAALPAIVTGLRMGFGLTFLGVVMSEMFASQAGLGFLLVQSVRLRDMPRLYGLVLLLTIFAFAVNGLFLMWERRVRHERAQGQESVTGVQ